MLRGLSEKSPQTSGRGSRAPLDQKDAVFAGDTAEPSHSKGPKPRPDALSEKQVVLRQQIERLPGLAKAIRETAVNFVQFKFHRQGMMPRLQKSIPRHTFVVAEVGSSPPERTMLEKLGKEPREPEKVIAALDLQEKTLVIPRPFQFLQKVEMIGKIDAGIPFPPLRQRLAMGVTGQDARDIVAHERVMDARPVKVFPHQDKEIQFRSDAQGTRVVDHGVEDLVIVEQKIEVFRIEENCFQSAAIVPAGQYPGQEMEVTGLEPVTTRF